MDLVRVGRLAPSPALVRVMLRAADILADLVRAARADTPHDAARAAAVAAELTACCGDAVPKGQTAPPVSAAPTAPAAAPPAAPAPAAPAADEEFAFVPTAIDLSAFADLVGRPAAEPVPHRLPAQARALHQGQRHRHPDARAVAARRHRGDLRPRGPARPRRHRPRGRLSRLDRDDLDRPGRVLAPRDLRLRRMGQRAHHRGRDARRRDRRAGARGRGGRGVRLPADPADGTARPRPAGGRAGPGRGRGGAVAGGTGRGARTRARGRPGRRGRRRSPAHRPGLADHPGRSRPRRPPDRPRGRTRDQPGHAGRARQRGGPGPHVARSRSGSTNSSS